MSFGESVFLVELFQKTINGDQNIKLNRVYPRQKLLQKVLEDSRSHVTEAEGRRLLGGGTRPHLQAACPPRPTGQSLFSTSVLHRLKDCIYAVYSSQFDQRVQD